MITRIRAVLTRRWFSSRATNQQSSTYCLELVKKHDYDHYLCTLLLPKPTQPAVFALRAYNVEVALVRDSVSEKHIGKMRLQFWREAIDSIFKGTSIPNHPVALSLEQAVNIYKLNKRWLTQLIDARETDLDTSVFYKTSDMEAYAEKTFSSLLYLTLEVLGIHDVQADHAASHIGKAEGIVTLIRAAAYHRAKRNVFIPMDIITRHGASQEDFLRGDMNKTIENCVYDFASLADAHLKKSQALAKQIPLAAIKAFLPAVLCRSFLNTLQTVGFNPFSSKLTIRNSLLPIKLLWYSWKNKY